MSLTQIKMLQLVMTDLLTYLLILEVHFKQSSIIVIDSKMFTTSYCINFKTPKEKCHLCNSNFPVMHLCYPIFFLRGE